MASFRLQKTVKTEKSHGDASMLEKYKAAMVLSGAGDALGYYRSKWEMNLVGNDIQKKVVKMGGIKNITTSMPKWIVSDDTVMHLATAEAIIEFEKNGGKVGGDAESRIPSEKFLLVLANYYKECMKDMKDRAPGLTTMATTHLLRPNTPGGYIIPFNPKGGGCGGAMRAMCIGMYYHRPEQLDSLIALSIESGRLTHNNPTGFLGALASALFASYAVQGKRLCCWGKGLMDSLPRAFSYVQESARDVEENKQHWSFFERAWMDYLQQRGLSDGQSEATFPPDYDVDQRDAFYKSISFSGWGGASGHDAPMIAYDALLGCHDDWQELSSRAFFHGGDSDSTAAIAACWFALRCGYEGVPHNNYKDLEYRDRLEAAGEALYNIATRASTT